MRRFAFAVLAASFALAGTAPVTSAGAATPGIDIAGPPAAGGAFWSGDRMRAAHERLKDMLPGSFA